jgi:hypothetical protein
VFDLHQNKPRSPKKPPDVVPIFVVITTFVRQLRFKYFALPGAKKMGKPEGASKFVVYYLVSKEKPTVDQLVHKATASEGELVIEFKDEERGLLGNRAQRPRRPQERNANGAGTVRGAENANCWGG